MTLCVAPGWSRFSWPPPTARDSSPRVSLQWRRDKYMEITAVINPRPRNTSTEFLSEFGATQGTLLGRKIAQSPRAEIRFRLYNR